MSFSNNDIQISDAPYAAESIPSTTKLTQQKGDFASNGMQPSFALELDISTITHVCYLKINIFFFFKKKKYVYTN
jgi:hypothetical protein